MQFDLVWKSLHASPFGIVAQIKNGQNLFFYLKLFFIFSDRFNELVNVKNKIKKIYYFNNFF